jgi:hypothetical protein
MLMVTFGSEADTGTVFVNFQTFGLEYSITLKPGVTLPGTVRNE